MKFPYGISDFKEIIQKNYFYCDRTHMISTIENSEKSVLFLRPRRFGKSLILSMLENYYDILKKDMFDQLFGHLKIGKNPTPMRNKFFILKLDFSCIGAYGSTEDLQRFMMDHVNERIRDFCHYYKNVISTPIDIHPDNAISTINSLLRAVKDHESSIYLLIDEYDNFANELMLNKHAYNIKDDPYTLFVNKDGPLKTLFKAIKAGTNSDGFDRTFITGVSPVVMSDITSGYNIARNIYLLTELNTLCGFLNHEIMDALKKIADNCELTEEQVDIAFNVMKIFYNGYKFALEANEHVYNPTLCLYFMNHFQRSCRIHRKLLDDNLAVDEQKIKYISELPLGEKLISALSHKNEVLEISELKERFSVSDLLGDDSKDNQFIISYMYYVGALTIIDENLKGNIELKIPNLVMKSIYIDHLRKMLLLDPVTRDKGLSAAEKVYVEGNIQPLCEFIVNKYFKILSNRDYMWANELTVKTAFITLLYNDKLYIMDSEKEIDRNYTDLTMIIRPDRRKFEIYDVLIEFKYVSLADAKLTGETAKQMDQSTLENLPCIQKSMTSALRQTKQYADVLTKKYSQLRLKSFAVVAVGFDRICWKVLE